MTRGVSEVPSKGRYAKVVSEDMGVLKLDTNVDYRDVGYDLSSADMRESLGRTRECAQLDASEPYHTPSIVFRHLSCKFCHNWLRH